MESNKAYHLVQLTFYEQHILGAHWGEQRWFEAKKRKLKDNPAFFEEDDKLEPHVIGVWGENAFAKANGVYYLPTINTFKKPDVNGFEVRCRTEHWQELIVRPQDDDDGKFALVTMDWEQPDWFRVYKGWIYGRYAKRLEWRKNHGNRKPAYFVPPKFLTLQGIPPVDFVIPERRFDDLITSASYTSARSGGL